MAKYRRCYAVSFYEVVVDNKSVAYENERDIAEVVLDHYLREKKHDNVYLIKHTRIRYTLVED